MFEREERDLEHPTLETFSNVPVVDGSPKKITKIVHQLKQYCKTVVEETEDVDQVVICNMHIFARLDRPAEIGVFDRATQVMDTLYVTYRKGNVTL